MQIHISPRHIALTAAIHGYVADKIGHLEDMVENILGAHVVLFHDERRNPKLAFIVKVHLAVPGPDIYAEATDGDLYAAIDGVTDKLARQLRKRKTRLVEKRKTTGRKDAELRKTRG
jgi:putative sigma-54 modulation protein